jgi:hypothetical protein
VTIGGIGLRSGYGDQYVSGFSDGATGLPRRSLANAPAVRRLGARRAQTSRDLPKPSLPLTPGLPEHAGMNPIETLARPGNAVPPASLRLGAVHLTVADLDRAVAWYERSLGLHLSDSGADRGDGHKTAMAPYEDQVARLPVRSSGLGQPPAPPVAALRDRLEAGESIADLDDEFVIRDRSQTAVAFAGVTS